MGNKRTKAGRKARRRAHALRVGWMHAPVRVVRISGEPAVVCYVCRAVQHRGGVEVHYSGCSVLRFSPTHDAPVWFNARAMMGVAS